MSCVNMVIIFKRLIMAKAT